LTEERAAALREIRSAVGAALAATRKLSEAHCRRPSAAEGWPLVIVAYHIGLGLRRQAGFMARALTREPPFEFDWEGTNEINAVNAREHGAMPMEDAAREIEDGWRRLESVIDRMTEKDWTRDVFSYQGRARSADVVLRRIVLPHVTDHLDSLRRSLAESRS
jgi:DinB family protein